MQLGVIVYSYDVFLSNGAVKHPHPPQDDKYAVCLESPSEFLCTGSALLCMILLPWTAMMKYSIRPDKDADPVFLGGVYL